MTVSASAVRHGLDQPTQWGCEPPPSYRRLRGPDERRGEPKRRKVRCMADYLICFDFPDMDDPCFAGWRNGTLGIAPTMKTAAHFDTWDEAERWLQNNYPSSREFGVVVETA